jgi:hypothetical protein
MSTALGDGLFPVNRIRPVIVPAVAGSTLKYTGAGSLAGVTGCSVLDLSEQPATSAAAKHKLRE